MDISPKITECEEYKILSSHLANPEKTDATLDQLTTCAKSSLSNDKLESHLRELWTSILHLSSQQSHTSKEQDSLVKLLQALITDAPSLKNTNNKEVEVDGSKVWQGLPLFGQQARECWNFPNDKEVDTKTREAWINVNAFVARLTAAAVNEHGGERPGYNALDYSLYGIWSLRSALEEETENLPGKTTIDASIGAAAAWILYAGRTLKGLSDSDKTYSGKVAKPGFKCKDQDWRGYNKDRWQLWTKELAESKNLVQDDGIQDLVKQALETMEQ
ncbi:unnamed protein product [Aureobasidium uvarum]|uniref:Uncharacterized protein n=1 Tax=Aureobasidium uvarum TaxID=2773716 RepID=A0A9N8KAL5_9PEZI|nr:unnamed protein product [Aureobasidium uvarum]